MSATLAAAQEQLHRRRQQRRQERIEQRLPLHTDPHGRSLLANDTTHNSASAPSNVLRTGYESQALWHSMQASQERRQAHRRTAEALALSWLPEPSPVLPAAGKRSTLDVTLNQDRVKTIALHPDLAIAILQNNLAAPGRLWLLLRHIDREGSGWVTVARAKQALTSRDSALRICGWRQMRNLLARGDGIFWQRNDRQAQDRVWLRSPAKVAASLGVSRLGKQPVALPLEALLQTVGTVRAHFFASFHSGRQSERPIARQTLQELTGVSRRSQRNYEMRAGVKKQHNWALAREHSEAAAQESAWRQGRAVFTLKDYEGKSGPAGRSYVAWQMPNSYSGPHTPLTITRKRRINQKLAVLLDKGITGNGETKVAEPASQRAGSRIRYHEHGRAAAKAYNRDASNDLYWRTPTTYQQHRVWRILPGQGDSKS